MRLKNHEQNQNTGQIIIDKYKLKNEITKTKKQILPLLQKTFYAQNTNS